MYKPIVSSLCTVVILCLSSSLQALECDTPQADWILCEGFEQGALGMSTWLQQSPFVECLGCDDAGRMRLNSNTADVYEGQWSLHMPAAASSNYLGGALVFRSCRDEKRAGCNPLIGYDRLYYRAFVKLAPTHRYVHHFMSIAGTRPDRYWESGGSAGCRPNGYRAAGTTVDFKYSTTRAEHELFFYTYFPEMHCDDVNVGGGYCGAMQPRICDECAAKEMPCENEPECCWGNLFSADPKPILPRGEWVCLEMMMQLNTPGQADGEMAFWINEQPGHRQSGMHWRDVAELQLNKINVQHYIDNGDSAQSNEIWWDNIVASTSRIYCGTPPSTDAGNTADTSASDVSTAHDVSAARDSANLSDGTTIGDVGCVPGCIDEQTLRSCNAQGQAITLRCAVEQNCVDAHCQTPKTDAGNQSDEAVISACSCHSLDKYQASCMCLCFAFIICWRRRRGHALRQRLH